MEHIIQVAIGIDDEAITKKINETAEQQIIAQIKKDVVLDTIQCLLKSI